MKNLGKRWIVRIICMILLVCAVPISDPMPVRAEDRAPEHHKYIKYNGNDNYTLTLDVKGMYDKEVKMPVVDVLLIIDKSASMNEKMYVGPAIFDWKPRMEVLKEIVTKTGGLSEAVLGNEQIDAQMAVVSYSGNHNRRDKPWNDADITCGWTGDKESLDRNVKGVNPDGGTNCHAGLYHGAQLLDQSRENAEKYVIFLSDGNPTFYYDSYGHTEGKGDEYDEQAAQKAKDQVNAISGLNGFYTIGIGEAYQSSFMQSLTDSSTAQKKHAYKSGNADELSQAFQDIVSEITEYTCRGVVIKDTLSEYVQLPQDKAENFNPVITAIRDDGQTTEVPAVSVQYHPQTKEIIAEFPKDYILPADVTYSISFDVEPSQKAYETYAQKGYVHTGSEGSDAPDNDTSSNKAGFYSNTTAELRYIYGKKEASEKTAEYLEKPVVQVETLEIPVEKRWEVPEGTIIPSEVEINLYQDDKPYKQLILNGGNEWKGVFERLSQNHKYSVQETEVPGYKSSITGDLQSGFVITNTYDLTELTVTKIWQDTGNIDKKRPSNITVELGSNRGRIPENIKKQIQIGYGEEGELLEGTEISEDENQWSYTWKELPITDENGTKIEYFVKEISHFPQYETSYGNDAFTIINTLRPSLMIEKIVEGDMGDQAKEFKFFLSLQNADKTPLTGTYSYQKIKKDGTTQTGNLSLKEGKGSISLSHEEKIIIQNLPQGTEYVLKEDPKDSQGYQVVYKEKSAGKLENQDVKVTVTNTRNQVPVTGIVDEGNGILVLMSAVILSGIFGVVLSLKRQRDKP